MSITYTPTTITTGFNVTDINANFTAIQTALTRAIDRGDTVGGNAMQQNLDLGSNDIINGGVGNFSDIIVAGSSVAASAAAAAASAAAALTSETNAATSETNAAASELLASQWATLTGALVAATDYSAKEYAVGTFTRGSIGSAKDWATYLGGSVDGSDYSARAWARSAILRGLTNGGSSKDWATLLGALADDTDYSAKEYAVGTTVAAGSAKQWATEAEDVLVNATEYSAFHWAQKAMVASGGDTVKVSSNDTTATYLINKLTALHGLTWTEINDAGDEDLQISIGSHLEIGGGANNNQLNVYEGTSAGCWSHYTNLTTGNGALDGFLVGINSSEQAHIWNYENTDTIFGSNNDEKMRLTTNGNLLFDTTTDAASYRIRCHDAASSGAQYIRFGNTTTGTLTSRGVVIGMNASEEMVLENKENTAVRFYANSGERFRIEASGDLKADSATHTIYDAAPPTGWEQGAMPIIEEDCGGDNSPFSVSGSIASGTWETVGPTGSGATNIWVAMDEMPTDARFAILKVDIELTGSTTATVYTADVFGRLNGAAIGLTSRAKIGRCKFTNQSAASETDASMGFAIVPVDANQIMQIGYVLAGTGATCNASLQMVGWL